ncbi:membrane protein [Citrobacter amalonaticus]
MNWKAFVLNFIGSVICILLIIMLSTQSKEWFIDGRGIKNICDVMMYIENDDIGATGMIITLPIFIPFLYVIIWKKHRSIWQYFVVLTLLSFWLWRFIIRYHLCL